ncbi:MAG: cytochrome c family protein [Verrucomicrobia bacterium]|nr:cytochrome c family protein [Verrucomicrobiota bacterium]
MKRVSNYLGWSALWFGLMLWTCICLPVQAYERYSSCAGCHGNFTDSTSPKGTIFPSNNKHTMHRSSSYMDAECNLCHQSGDDDDPYIGSSNGTANNPGMGCIGCHLAEGLRAKHAEGGVASCGGCHSDGPPSPENVKPPYYDTADTKVKNPANDVKAANTNENWSVGDFLGLDNDGNGLYDLADFACGRYRILSATKEGNDVRITWETAGGRKDAVQAATDLGGSFADIGAATLIPGVGIVVTNRLEVGAATNATRFFRLRYAP